MMNQWSPPSITMAFQPIVDIEEDCRPYAYEALVRGTHGATAAEVLSSVPPEKSVEFDALCRSLALNIAHMLGLRGRLSLNISPSALCSVRHGIQSTLKAAEKAGFPADRLIFEVTEHEPFVETLQIRRWLAVCRNRGVRIALDDFGTGYSGLNTILQIKPDIVKIDRAIVSRIDRNPAKLALVKGVLAACNGIGISVVAEGVETEAEANTLRSFGVRYMQGYLFGKPTVGQFSQTIRARAFA